MFFKRGTIDSHQGHPTTVFCTTSVRRSKYCLEFSITWGGLKSSTRPFHSCTIFEAHLINSLYGFLKFNFSHFNPQLARLEMKPKIFGFKNVMKRGNRKILISFLNRLNPIWNFRENNYEALVISKRLGVLGWPNRYKFYSAAYNTF